MDSTLVSLWRNAQENELERILQLYSGQPGSQGSIPPDQVRAGLACLAEAGLLTRSGKASRSEDYPHMTGQLVSAVIVNYNSLEWLSQCISSLSSQTYAPLEIIVVDNGSSEDIRPWLSQHEKTLQVYFQEGGGSLASAINAGISHAAGEFFLILNPDVRLEPYAVAELVSTARDDPSCAAVAAKLKFSWAPGFLNGLGNHVPAFAWGSDIGLGHLDLGQFDAWKEVPSACFAAALVTR